MEYKFEDTQGNSYTVEQLSEAFDKVANPAHWKLPISAIIRTSDVPVTSAAIEFYTATEATIVERPAGSGQAHIVSIGYAAGPAGDP